MQLRLFVCAYKRQANCLAQFKQLQSRTHSAQSIQTMSQFFCPHYSQQRKKVRNFNFGKQLKQLQWMIK
nr:hypothetical transcript [Hymenolepis microstoma]